MMKQYLLILLIPFLCYTQDEKLRIETINVFKEFQPKISNSKKLGEQPIFNDTLSVNVVSPQSIWNQKGADILRAWVASTEFRNEMNFSNEILDRTTDSYRKIRNTIRFLLSNLYDFDQKNNLVQSKDLVELDLFIVSKAMNIQKDIVADYENFDFHLAFQKILNFCSNELGSFYLDIIKDRAYTSHQDGPARRSSQTAMFHVLQMLLRWVSPIISFTAEEAWQELSHNGRSIFEEEWYFLDDNFDIDLDVWNDLINLKDDKIEWFEDLSGEKEDDIADEVSKLIEAASDFYDLQIEGYE